MEMSNCVKNEMNCSQSLPNLRRTVNDLAVHSQHFHLPPGIASTSRIGGMWQSV